MMKPGLRYLPALFLLLLPWSAKCQTETSAPYQLYGGFSYLSNSFNGVPGSRSALLGWDSSAAFPGWRGLRFKIDVSGTTGTNLGAPQHALFILGGGEYEHKVWREKVFAQALFGDAGINRNWGANQAPGGTASFVMRFGGGVDTPVSRHFAFRVEGDLDHTNFYLVAPVPPPTPFRIAGMPNFFGRISTGVVWTPRTGSPTNDAIEAVATPKAPVASEWVIEESNSVGHYHIFAGTWWSYMHVAGVEYDRHTWGTFLHARMDYVAEILPVVVLEQPSQTDPWGDPLSTSHTTVHGMGISPIGMRLLWREGTRWKPYYVVKGGMVGFTQKALSQFASYENFSLQQATGIQFRINDAWDVRAGVSDFHFSNGFIVPNNPGIDDMMYGAAVSYRLHAGSAATQ